MNFGNSKIEISTDRHRHLGAVVGSETNEENFIAEKVVKWEEEIKTLLEIACTQPHAAYAALVHGVIRKYTFVMRTVPNISTMLKHLDEAIDDFIKVILQGYTFNDAERLLFSLPAKYGALGIIIQSMRSDLEYQNSLKITKVMSENVKNQDNIYDDRKKEKSAIKSQIRTEKQKLDLEKLILIKGTITSKSKFKAIEACNENGASIWLTVLPIKRNGFFLEKQAFWDGVKIRYNIPLDRIPTTCVCGHSFDIQHAFSCPKGGLMINRHNEIRDVTVEILKEICTNVGIEPALIPLTGEQLKYKTSNKADLARYDVSVKSFWIKGQITYCDVVFSFL